MNTRKDNNGVATKQWLALGLASVCKPLRYIRAKCAREIIGPDGKKQTVYEAPYQAIERLARQGQGRAVQQTALKLASS